MDDLEGVAPGDIDYFNLLYHNRALINNLKAVEALKEALGEEDFEQAAMYVCELGNEVMAVLWVAPSKGGIFTTEERKQIKSDEFSGFIKTYMQENNND